MVAVRQGLWFDGQRSEGLYGCGADACRQRRCPRRCYGLYDNHPALTVGADANLPALELPDLHVVFLPALLGQRRSSELFLYVAELVAA